MARNKEPEARPKMIAEDFHLRGGGPKELSQLVARHLSSPEAAERRSMGWREMIGVLTTAGSTGRGGEPIGIGTLSSIVGRKRLEAAEKVGHRHRRSWLNPPRPVSSRQKSPSELLNGPPDGSDVG